MRKGSKMNWMTIAIAAALVVGIYLYSSSNHRANINEGFLFFKSGDKWYENLASVIILIIIVLIAGTFGTVIVAGLTTSY